MGRAVCGRCAGRCAGGVRSHVVLGGCVDGVRAVCGRFGRGGHMSSSVSCLSALRAMTWNACSTLIASLAEVSK